MNEHTIHDCQHCGHTVDSQTDKKFGVVTCDECGNVIECDDDIFSDAYASVRARTHTSINEIEEKLANESAETTKKRHAKHTRKPRREGPETKVKARVRAHLEKHYNALVLRTNAGWIKDEHGNPIHLGEAGQADLHAIVPLTINGMMIGLFVAIETKAGSNKPTDAQKHYLARVTKRGGLAIVAYSVIDIDNALHVKITELTAAFAQP